MTTGLFGLVAFVLIFGGGMLGLYLGDVLPEGYRGGETQKIVQTAMGMVSLLAALVLGLLVATAKNKFDTNKRQTEQFAAGLMLLNRELVNYGPEANDIRSVLWKYVDAKIATDWPLASGPKPKQEDPPIWQLLERVQQKLRGLAPKSESQRSTATSASQIATELTKTTWLQAAQESDHVPHTFVYVLILWFSILFISFGLFAPRNRLVVMALLVGALAVAGAVVLIVDMDSPFEGILVVSAEPMQEALAEIGAP